METSNLFAFQTLPKQEVVCRYMEKKRPTKSQIIILIVLSLLFIISGLIFFINITFMRKYHYLTTMRRRELVYFIVCYGPDYH